MYITVTPPLLILGNPWFPSYPQVKNQSSYDFSLLTPWTNELL